MKSDNQSSLSKMKFGSGCKEIYEKKSGFWREIQIQNRNSKIANFKRDYLDNDNDSEFTVKTKNAPFFTNFPNIYKLWQISLI